MSKNYVEIVNETFQPNFLSPEEIFFFFGFSFFCGGSTNDRDNQNYQSYNTYIKLINLIFLLEFGNFILSFITLHFNL